MAGASETRDFRKIWFALSAPLYEDTVYEMKMTNTKSEKYMLRRGFREGCPSSCTIYNLVHNVAVEALQEKWRESSSCTQVVLLFTMGSTVTRRSWKRC